jgi:hypothetical protein
METERRWGRWCAAWPSLPDDGRRASCVRQAPAIERVAKVKRTRSPGERRQPDSRARKPHRKSGDPSTLYPARMPPAPQSNLARRHQETIIRRHSQKNPRQRTSPGRAPRPSPNPTPVAPGERGQPGWRQGVSHLDASRGRRPGRQTRRRGRRTACSGRARRLHRGAGARPRPLSQPPRRSHGLRARADRRDREPAGSRREASPLQHPAPTPSVAAMGGGVALTLTWRDLPGRAGLWCSGPDATQRTCRVGGGSSRPGIGRAGDAGGMAGPDAERGATWARPAGRRQGSNTCRLLPAGVTAHSSPEVDPSATPPTSWDAAYRAAGTAPACIFRTAA